MKKKTVAILLILCFGFLIFVPCREEAYAETVSVSNGVSGRQMGAWVMSALTALSITWNSTLAPVGKGLDFFNDAYYITDTHTMEHIPFTNDNVYDILDQSVISFSDGEVVIDGKHYQNVWLSHDAAEKFRVNAFDIQSAFNIASNSNGTYVSGEGYIDGVPIYNLNPADPNFLLSPLITLSPEPPLNQTAVYSIGNAFLSCTKLSNSGWHTYSMNWSNGSTASTEFYYGFGGKAQYSYRIGGQQYLSIGPGQTSIGGIPAAVVDLTPFDFAWTSGEIPAPGAVLPSDHGLNTYVPSRPEEWTDNPNVQQTINNYNDFVENNPEFSPGLDVDLDKDTDILDKLGDLMDILGPLINLMHPEFGPKAEPTPPEPSDSIADTPWVSLRNFLDRILEKLSDIFGKQSSIENTIGDGFDSLEDTITDSLGVPNASSASTRRFNLSGVFPFCIPFDIYRMLQAFDGTPAAPHVQIPIVIDSIGFSYTMDLDFSAFNSVASILRTVEFIAFGVALAFATSKVIRW